MNTSITFNEDQHSYKVVVTGENGKKVQGYLPMGDEGYVYQAQTRTVIWIKFLGLGLCLPFAGCIAKCAELAATLFGITVTEKGFHDLVHMGRLSQIAWKAVVGWDGKSVREYVEEFSLEEMDYNNPDRNAEMAKPRSRRFSEGMYIAKCMNPLFHKDQINLPYTYSYVEINAVKLKIIFLEKALENKKQYNFVSHCVNSLINPYTYYTKEKISAELQASSDYLNNLVDQQTCAERCHKYARQAILNQHCLDLAVRELEYHEEKVECCGSVIYRHQRICGIFHKINFYDLTCYAIDCLCCFCCLIILPENKERERREVALGCVRVC